MKTKYKIIIGLVVVISLIASGIFGYVIFQTMSHMDKAAVAQMNKEEREWLELVDIIHADMTADEVHDLLGDPTSSIVMLSKWNNFAGSEFSQLRIYFLDDHPIKIRWIKIGSFLYEKDLLRPKHHNEAVNNSAEFAVL
jgi:hypothetical protein